MAEITAHACGVSGGVATAAHAHARPRHPEQEDHDGLILSRRRRRRLPVEEDSDSYTSSESGDESMKLKRPQQWGGRYRIGSSDEDSDDNVAHISSESELLISGSDDDDGAIIFRPRKRPNTYKVIEDESDSEEIVSIGEKEDCRGDVTRLEDEPTPHEKDCKWGANNPLLVMHDLSLVREGDRVAFDFDGTTHFGTVENCRVKRSNRKKWRWHVLFDDGEGFVFSPSEMREALSLYEDCRRKEMEDPSRPAKIKAMKDAFERERDEVLKQLPGEVKGQFLQIGFASWSTFVGTREQYLPVLFLGPYDVSPGNLRDEWLAQFAQTNFDWKKMPCLVYWLGADKQKLDKAFSFIPRARCLSYEFAEQLGLHKLPTKTQEKIHTKKYISTSENFAVRAWKEMKECLSKPQDERARHFKKLKEDHELVLEGRLLIELEAEAALQEIDG